MSKCGHKFIASYTAQRGLHERCHKCGIIKNSIADALNPCNKPQTTIEQQIKEFNAQPEEMRTMNTENEKKHLEWPFYKAAEAYREAVRKGQIIKGAHKYPEPFTTASWSNEQLLEHAMQENVDQAHYIYAAAERMRELESKLDKVLSAADYYKKALEFAKEELEKARRGCEDLRKERDEWKKRAVKAEMDVTDLEFKLKQETVEAHDCYKNQIIHWGSTHTIRLIRCAVCNKTLFGE